MESNIPTGYSFRSDDKQIMTSEKELNRDALVKELELYGFKYAGACHDDRSRDAILRMVQDFSSLAAVNAYDSVVESSFLETMNQISDMVQLDKKDCKHCR